MSKNIYLESSFLVRVKEILEDESTDKKGKSVINTYLVKGYTPGEVEVRVAEYYGNLKIDYSIIGMTQSKIKEILGLDE
jgi:hypothetical protein